MTYTCVNYYALLGVERDASEVQIKRAFMQRLSGLPEGPWRSRLWLWATGESKETLCLARDTLIDKRRRARYDQKLASEAWYWIPMQ